MPGQSIIRRRMDKPGHEFARLFFDDSFRHLHGTAIFVNDKQPCRLDYRIKCNSEWETLPEQISGWIGEKAIEIEIIVERNHRWRLNGQECVSAVDCIDLCF